MLWPALKVNRGISIGNSLFDEARDVGCQEKIDHPKGQIPWNLNYEMGTLYTPGYETSFLQTTSYPEGKMKRWNICVFVFIHTYNYIISTLYSFSSMAWEDLPRVVNSWLCDFATKPGRLQDCSWDHGQGQRKGCCPLAQIPSTSWGGTIWR